MQNERLGLPAVAVSSSRSGSSGSFESTYQVAGSSNSTPLYLSTSNQYNSQLAHLQNFQRPQGLFHQLAHQPEIATSYHHHLYNSNLVHKQQQQQQCARCQHHYLLPTISHCPVTDHNIWQHQQQHQLLGMPTVCSHYGHVNAAESRTVADQHHHLHQQQQHQVLQHNLVTSLQPPVTNTTTSTNETVASSSIRCLPRARVGSVSYSQTAPALSSSFITRSTSHTALTSDINLPELKTTNEGGGSASYQQQDSPLLGSLLTYAPASYTPGTSSSPAHPQLQHAHSPALSSSTATSMPSITPNEALNLGINLEQYISKRNERERSRVRNVNDAFDNLKNSLPLELEKASKRMSKVEILRTAIGYIRNLEQVLGYKKQQQQQQQYVDASEQATSDDSGDKTHYSKSSSFVPLTQTNQSPHHNQHQLIQATTQVTQTTANKQEPTNENYIDLMRNLEFDQFQDQNY